MLRCSGLMRSDSSASGSPRASSREVPSPMPSPSRSTMERCAVAACAAASPSSVVRLERTPGRVSTACMVSSRRQTQSCTSWSGRLQSSAKRATLPGTSNSVDDSGQGRGSAYWPKARRARCPAAEPNCMPRKTGPSVRANWLRSPAIPDVVVRVELGQVHGRRHGRCALPLRLDHRLEGWAVGLEHTEGPLPGADGVEGHAAGGGRRRRDAGGVGHVQLGHPGQLLEGDAHEGVGGFSSCPPSVATPKARVRAASNQLSPAPARTR